MVMNLRKLIGFIFCGIGIAAIVSIASYPTIKSKVNERVFNSNKKIIEHALEFYHADFGAYPESLDFLVWAASKPILNEETIKIGEWSYSRLEDSKYSLNSKL